MIIKNGRVIDPKNKIDQIMDIKIEDGVITALGSFKASPNEECVDASGLVVAPGLIDVHVHFRDPGLTYKEDIHTGALAAARGGYTTVICMANTKPSVDNLDTLSYVIKKGEKEKVRVLTTAAVSQGLKGEKLVKMEDLAANGAVGFTDDGIPLMDEKLVLEAMQRAKALNLPISFHEEDPALIINSGVNHGVVSEKLGIFGAPAAAEDVLVARDCMLSLYSGATINIQHISSANSVALVRTAKQLGAPVYAEATPHHFSLTEEAVLEYGTLAKMNPPLRTQADQDAIIQGLKDGTIDIIATDHAPHSADEKARPFLKAPSGIIGLETALALGITNLVKKGLLSLCELLEKLTINPATLYHLPYGTIEVGACADLVLFDENETWTPTQFASKSSNSPFTGKPLTGKVKMTICNGLIAYQDL
mgnify:CR=1 FL=1